VPEKSVTKRPQRSFGVLCGLSFITAVSLLAAARSFPSYASVKPILDAHREHLPAELRNVDER